MTERTRRTLQATVVGLGLFFFITNLAMGGVTLGAFLPLVGLLLGLIAIEQVRRNQERDL